LERAAPQVEGERDPAGSTLAILAASPKSFFFCGVEKGELARPRALDDFYDARCLDTGASMDVTHRPRVLEHIGHDRRV
jgi:hypothetical protein